MTARADYKGGRQWSLTPETGFALRLLAAANGKPYVQRDLLLTALKMAHPGLGGVHQDGDADGGLDGGKHDVYTWVHRPRCSPP